MSAMTESLPVRIYTLRQDEPVLFAAGELRRYLGLMGAAPNARPFTPEVHSGHDPAPGLRLGAFADFGAQARDWPPVREPAWDDAIVVDTDGASGLIAGSNPRSVLLAVYRYLAELGARWVRPGRDGERVPPVDLAATRVHVAEGASYRHRGICIEGAVGDQHVRDIVDWAPKVGFNTYFTQFREAYTFFERWYRHRGNPLLAPEPFSLDDARALKRKLVSEIERRGMVFHDVGHGWTCEPLGVSGLGWEYDAPPVPEAKRRYLAEIDGTRDWWRGVPLNTNLCFSNPEVRDLLVGDVTSFAQAHPQVDVLHFWLGDGSNNQCECPQCQTARPADWYVLMLDEIDAKLTALGLPTRIVFLIYVDLLWPPERERLQHPDRFILMFAPITRTYTTAFTSAFTSAETGDLPALPPYERNRLKFPRDVASNVSFLRAWQRLFDGDSFDFDYHYMWDHYKDPGYVAIARVLHADVQGLAKLGLDGLVSCQEQRTFFPTGLGMTVMGRTLWDRALEFEPLADDYFRAAFGDDGAQAYEYCQALSRAFDPPYIRNEKPREDQAVAAAYAEVPALIEQFRPVIQRHQEQYEAAGDTCRARSWHYLDVHAQLCLGLAEALRLRAAGQPDAAQAAWQPVKRLAQERELDLQSVLDVYEYTRVLDGVFRPPTPR